MSLQLNSKLISQSSVDVGSCSWNKISQTVSMWWPSSQLPVLRFTCHTPRSRGHLGPEEVLDLVAVPLQPLLVEQDVLDALLHRPLGRVEVGLEEGLDLVRHLTLVEVERGVLHDAVVQLAALVPLLERLRLGFVELPGGLPALGVVGDGADDERRVLRVKG